MPGRGHGCRVAGPESPVEHRAGAAGASARLPLGVGLTPSRAAVSRGPPVCGDPGVIGCELYNGNKELLGAKANFATPRPKPRGAGPRRAGIAKLHTGAVGRSRGPRPLRRPYPRRPLDFRLLAPPGEATDQRGNGAANEQWTGMHLRHARDRQPRPSAPEPRPHTVRARPRRRVSVCFEASGLHVPPAVSFTPLTNRLGQRWRAVPSRSNSKRPRPCR